MSSTGDPAAGPPPQEPGEEQLRAAYEAELARITTTDMIAQSAISLLNLGARRLAPADTGAAAERDLEQARDAIDAARALIEILERRIPSEIGPLRDALSRLQMAYATEVREPTPAAAGSGAGEPARGGEGSGNPEGPGQGSASGGDEGSGPGGGPGPGGGGSPGGGSGPGEGSGPGAGGGSGGGAEQGPQQPGEEGQHPPGPAESSGRLWVPGR